jgi:hypothetical protein
MWIGTVLMPTRIRCESASQWKFGFGFFRIGMKTMPIHITASETINPGFDPYSVGGAGTVKQCAYFDVYSKEDIQHLACHMTYCRLFSTDVTVGTMRPKARELAQHGGLPVTQQYVMDGPCRLPPDGLHHLSQSGADLFLNVHKTPP